uniref:Uncharacterized protein n=1 Tax=Siphoviridae sp. ct3es5 TaxID=2825322 RepID=A0A8S5PVN7_9CAUD|nr:MAG TPA: hypothetical protein [Siphoviridae sp. ct3es5]
MINQCFSLKQITTDRQKKDRPRWWHTGSGQAKQTPFEVNVSTSIEHYITLGLALPYPFSTKGQVI